MIRQLKRAVPPAHYSLLQPNGKGIQLIYLAEISQNFAEVLAGLIGVERHSLISAEQIVASDRLMIGDDLDMWEHWLEERVTADLSIADTEREAIVRARRGQRP